MPRKPHAYHYLYKTTNLINTKFYVGMHSTSNLNDGYLGSGVYLRRSIRKYGETNFKMEILEFCDSREILIEKEKEFVNIDFISNPFCMNLMIGGGRIEFSEETCLKISEAGKGKKRGPRPDSVKAKISNSHIGIGKGIKRPEKEKAKISKGLIESYSNGSRIPWQLGKTQSNEHKFKKSESLKKEIIQYNLTGTILKEWPSATDANKELGYKGNGIGLCCMGKSRSAYGFIWKFK